MGPKTVGLLGLLQDTVELLQDCGETHWASWMQKSKDKIKNGDFNGITLLLKAYGGMGSFNDLVIHPLNGHNVNTDEVDKVNEKLVKLRQKIYELATQIKREAVTSE